MRVITYYHIMILLCAFAALVLLLPSLAQANWAQKHICLAGINVGQAQARAELYGQANDGVIPPAQMDAIEDNLTTASAEMTTAESLFVEPFASYRAEQGNLTKVVSEITRYPTFTAGWSYQHRTAYIRTIYGMYHNGLAITYVSPRDDDLDGFRKVPNCDSTLFRACYHYGMATIASGVGGHFARGAQSEANGLFRNAVQSGLKIAMDAAGHLPDDGITKKVCCTFGTPAQWRAMNLAQFQQNSPTTLYVVNTDPILSIIGTATELDPLFCDSDRKRCASSRVRKRKQSDGGGGGGFTGRWRCGQHEGEGEMEIKQSGNSAEITDPFTGQVYQGQVSGDTIHFVVPSTTDISGTKETRQTVKLRPDGSIIDWHAQLYTNGRKVPEFDMQFSCSRVTN